MTFTTDQHAALTSMASHGWAAYPVANHRLTSDARAGLAVFLTEAQRGICAFCGEAGVSELCHIVPGGPERMGWVAPNIAMGCAECNDLDGKAIVEFATIVRPDLIQTVWPATPVLSRMGREEKVRRESARARKANLRGM